MFQLAVLKASASGCVTVLFLAATAQTAAQGSTVFIPLSQGHQPNLWWQIRDHWVPPSLAENIFAAKGILGTTPSTLPRMLPASPWGPFMGLCM